MRTRIFPVLALCLLTLSSPVKSASFCPYHWALYVVMAAEGLRNLAPEYHRPLRAVQLVAGGTFIGFTGHYLYGQIIQALRPQGEDDQMPRDR